MNVRAVLAAAGLILVVLTGAACGGGKEGAPPATPPRQAATPSGPVTISFWHVATGGPKDTLTRLTDQFNASQDRITVSLVFQGTYDDNMNKILASLGSGDLPALAQLDDPKTQLIADSGAGGADQTPVATQRLCASGSVPVNGHVCGQDSAPVKIVELSDYQCPFCKRFVDGTEPQVESEYIEKGLVQLEFHYFAITGGNAPPDSNEATLAAEAAECANDQGRFWEYHYKLYAEQRGENQGAFLSERLKQFATDLGLDRGEFDACLDSHKHIGLVEKQRDQAFATGANGTPSFLINGKLLVGYQPFEKFRQHIEEALTKP